MWDSRPSEDGIAIGAAPLMNSQTAIPVTATVPEVAYRTSSVIARDLRPREKPRPSRATNPLQLSAR
jgi:hypothetical protein